MKFENTQVFNFEGALRGMRNPLASWAKNDGYSLEKVGHNSPDSQLCDYHIGENDMKLARKLIEGGTEHRKFLRQIMVSVDITAPEYFWSQFDTYKVGTTANSTSKMHKLASAPITLECFETDDYVKDISEDIVQLFLEKLEGLRVAYNETKDKKIWKELLRWLPESWLQTRTVTLNYEVIRTMYHQRKLHKLNE